MTFGEKDAPLRPPQQRIGLKPLGRRAVQDPSRGRGISRPDEGFDGAADQVDLGPEARRLPDEVEKLLSVGASRIQVAGGEIHREPRIEEVHHLGPLRTRRFTKDGSTRIVEAVEGGIDVGQIEPHPRGEQGVSRLVCLWDGRLEQRPRPLWFAVRPDGEEGLHLEVRGIAGAAGLEPLLVVAHSLLRLAHPGVVEIVHHRVVERDAGDPVVASLGGLQVTSIKPLEAFFDLSHGLEVVAYVAVGKNAGGIGVGPRRLGDLDGSGRQLGTLFVFLVEAGQTRQTDIGDRQIRARPDRFEGRPRRLVLAAGEIGAAL